MEAAVLKKACYVLFSVFLTGCAARYNIQMTGVVESWMGHNVKEVIESWGPPSTVYDEPPNLKVYAWHSQQSFTLSGDVQTIDYGSGVKQQTVHPGRTITKNHYKMFWVNPDGVIVKWKFGTQ